MCKKVRKISYLELKQNVAKLAGALKGKGIKKGDRVIIYCLLYTSDAADE